jgi:hypothetical protein
MKAALLLTLVLTGRNLFKYVEAPPRPPKKKPAAAVVVAPPPVVVVEPERVPPPPATFDFPYRYIGSFGPEGNLIAVFVGDDVVTARAGDSFGDAFVVREITITGVVVSRGALLRNVALAQ